MNTYCPVCNGLRDFQAKCGRCGTRLIDFGRSYDYFGPYSPYRPIDDMKWTNGLPDLLNHQCIHAAFCEKCGQTFNLAVDEQA
ncbi:hypothetical protein [Ferviditalea candida]|uniref:Uncharacterized protein n=1 Tax=Ferviditalea candida TaxID=3108399 RepID=A0ABU5ZGP5_9BACL|nr:hypothetical protein [Paenibacillaceae bacterium T2]